MKAENWICCVSCTLRIVFVSKEELASLCSPIPVWGSLARNQQTPDGVCNRFCFMCLCLSFFLGGIGFALLAHPNWVILCKKSATTWRCLLLIFVSYLLVSELPAATKRKSGATFVVPDFLRRGRDSNPRYLSVRRFSRPVQSTTLPPLQRFFVSHDVVVSF